MRYDVLLFLHITAAIVWIGGGIAIQVLIQLAESRRDEPTFAGLVRLTSLLGPRMFVPSSLLVLLLGIGLVADGPWTAGQLWIVLGIIGFAATFATGVLVLRPRSDRLAELAGPEGTLGPEAKREAMQLLAYGRLDFVVLLLVVFDMAVKPTGDDVGTLVFMALALLVGVALLLARARRAGEPSAAPA